MDAAWLLYESFCAVVGATPVEREPLAERVQRSPLADSVELYVRGNSSPLTAPLFLPAR